MGRRLATKQNVDAPNGTYPFARIRDNFGMNDGTPFDESLYGDIQQFMEKMFDNSGVVANGLPDNATNGFQFFEALQHNIHKYKAIVSTFGNTSLTADQFGSLFVTLGGGVQTLPISFPGDNNNGKSFTFYNFNNAYTLVTVAGGNTLYGCTNNTVELRPGDVVTITQWSYGTYFVSQKRTYASNTVILPIGSWNMLGSGTFSVAHGLTLSRIRSINVSIQDDGGFGLYPLKTLINLTPGGNFYADATNINLFAFSDAQSGNVYTGALLSAFRNGSYSGSANRGWIIIDYAD